MRFLLIGPDRLAKRLETSDLVVDGPCQPTGGAGMTLIELVYGRDREALERLRRPKGVAGPGPWAHDPDGFARYMDEGDWRHPEGVARRPAGTMTDGSLDRGRPNPARDAARVMIK